MDWDQYYEKFYDWATSTQISRKRQFKPRLVREEILCQTIRV